jgi:DNA relaxase NicK
VFEKQDAAMPLPPSGNTGATVTTGEVMRCGLHHYEGTSGTSSKDALRYLGRLLGMSPIPVARSKWYRDAWTVGPVTVRAHGVTGDAERMGVLIQVRGQGCDELGLRLIAEMHRGLKVRASRLDGAIDGCPFTPGKLARAWRAGRVRTKVKVTKDARPGREWRECEWDSNAKGDTFYMGGKHAERRACVYDMRGPTRFEMRWRHATAAAVADDLLRDVGEGWGERLMAYVRGFVDFVSLGQANSSRRGLLPWWADFVGDAGRATVSLERTAPATYEKMLAWFERSGAAMAAVIAQREGAKGMAAILRRGRAKWDTHHHRLAGAFVPLAPVGMP